MVKGKKRQKRKAAAMAAAGALTEIVLYGDGAPTTKCHPPGLGSADALGARRQCSDAVYLRGGGG